MVGLTFVALAVAFAAGAAPATGLIGDSRIDELSGLAVSRADPALLWGHNDTGSGPVLYRMDGEGAALGRVRVPGAEAGDWEDIAAFSDAGGPALLIGDVGDNLALRGFVTLYAVRDPGRRGDVAPLLWRLDFRYPDGPRDCEALAVDAPAGEILLVSKRDTPARLYRLALPRRPPRHPQTAEFLGTLPTRPPIGLGERLRAPLASVFFNAPTALDISADGGTAVLVTPRAAYVYRREPHERWSEVLLRAAPGITLPAFDQIEAGALSADGRVLHVGSEGQPGRWARIELAPGAGRDPSQAPRIPAAGQGL